MSTLKWFPIDPTLTKEGGFLAFSGKKNSLELKPLHLEADVNEFSQFKVMQTSCNLRVAADLGINIGSLEGSLNAFVLNYEAMVYSEAVTNVPIGGKIYGTRWGAGLRVNLKISELNSSAKVSFGAIAASTELGLSRVEFEIHGIGVTEPDILKVLPGPGDFNFESYKKVLEAVDLVKNYMADHSEKLVARPFQVYLNDDFETEVYEESRSIFFATKSIADRKTLRDAIAEAKGRYSIPTLRSVYSKYHILSEDSEPTREQKKEADKFLEL